MASAGREAAVPADLGGESSLLSRPSWLPSKGSTPPAPRGRGQDKDAKLRKSCNCRNSRCLKLYCECFASGQYCFACNCQACHNNPENDEMRKRAIEQTLERNPSAFRPKINHSAPGNSSTEALGRHNKGCHCKKSGCLKKYCECFQAAIMCNEACKCSDCKNFEGSVDRAALLGLHPQLMSPTNAKRAKPSEPASHALESGPTEPPSAHAKAQAQAQAQAQAAQDSPLLRAREAIATAIDDEMVATMCTRMLDRAVPLARPAGAAGPSRLSAAEAAAAYERQEHEVLAVLHAELCAIQAIAAAASRQPPARPARAVAAASEGERPPEATPLASPSATRPANGVAASTAPSVLGPPDPAAAAADSGDPVAFMRDSPGPPPWVRYDAAV